MVYSNIGTLVYCLNSYGCANQTSLNREHAGSLFKKLETCRPTVKSDNLIGIVSQDEHFFVESLRIINRYGYRPFCTN
jgi:hypothetical protein